MLNITITSFTKGKTVGFTL